ncbi:MAG: ABC transporter substrate-binding protein [Magnetovibrio sp.]|nr:ABC transporter substrate-binding protein [Magnetovibrio sp.]
MFFVSSSALAAEPVIFAVNVALTGIENAGDRGIVAGAKLAAKIINAQGGLRGRPLELLFVDNYGTDIGARNAASMILKTRAVAMIGAGRSSRSLVAAEVAQQGGMPMVTPYSTHPDITKTGNQIFRIGFNDEFQGKALGEFAARSLKLKHAIILENVSEEYSSILANHFTQSYERNGGRVVWRGHYRRTTIDFSSLLKAVKEHSFDIIFIPGYTKRSAWLIRQARKMGIKAQFLGGDGWGASMFEYGGEAIEGQLSTDHWHRDVDTPFSTKFLEAYHLEYGQQKIMSTGTVLTYDAVNLLAAVVRSAAGEGRKAVQKGLQGVRGFQGGTGEITFDQFGDPKNKDIVFTRFENGQKSLVGVFKCCAVNEVDN